MASTVTVPPSKCPTTVFEEVYYNIGYISWYPGCWVGDKDCTNRT